MTTKHELILKHIETLPVGDKISVRGIAKSLRVSEGTAYRAIKEAENEGLVSTIERVGTIRIERKRNKMIERLTFGEIVRIIEGEVLGGKRGLDKVLNGFIIGAMRKEAIERYIIPGGLMIVGNRTNIQKYAIEQDLAVLITGGFDVEDEIIALADRSNIPIIRTTYDTFTVATMINRALSDQLIKKDIMLLSDIYTPLERTNYLTAMNTVKDYMKLVKDAGETKIPIVAGNRRLVGIVTGKDVFNRSPETTLDKVMTKDPIVARKSMSVASVSHQMVWDGLEVLPVVNDDYTLTGVVSRYDVMKATQLIQRQQQQVDTLSDQIAGLVVEQQTSEMPRYEFEVTPQMVNSMGTISYGVLSEIVADVTERVMTGQHKRNIMIEQMSLYYMRVVQLESKLLLVPKILESSRRAATLDIEIFIDSSMVAKAIVTLQMLERN
ncbi:MAG: CBS domain-containing protein [Lactobacillales bacterium]|jgi:predicted transcriptional regulator|nr:CBS domain-containing protein [Lactobacillales bacterium]